MKNFSAGNVHAASRRFHHVFPRFHFHPENTAAAPLRFGFRFRSVLYATHTSPPPSAFPPIFRDFPKNEKRKKRKVPGFSARPQTTRRTPFSPLFPDFSPLPCSRRNKNPRSRFPFPATFPNFPRFGFRFRRRISRNFSRRFFSVKNFSTTFPLFHSSRRSPRLCHFFPAVLVEN